MAIGKCYTSVTVSKTTHRRDGDTGGYFYFDEDVFTEMVGYDDWDGSTFEITQTGYRNSQSLDWTGTVEVWKGTTGNGGAHGRRHGGKAPGQWKVGDMIVPESCGKYMQCICGVKLRCISSNIIWSLRRKYSE